MNSLPQRLSATRQRMQHKNQSRFKQLRYQFDLLRHLVWRDFSLRYKRSVLGVVWSLVFPIAQLLVLVFLFQSVVPLNIPGYPVFVFCALLPWSWFSGSIASACGLFIGNRDLVRHPNFTPSLLMMMNTFSNFIAYLVALPILFAVLFIYQFPITPALLVLPLLLLIQSVLINGVSLIVATLNVFYRDVQHIVLVGLTLLFYLTPVFYRSQAVVQQYQSLYNLSPIAALIQGYRAIFFYGLLPERASVLYAAISSLVIYAIGYTIYRFFQHDIIDEL